MALLIDLNVSKVASTIPNQNVDTMQRVLKIIKGNYFTKYYLIKSGWTGKGIFSEMTFNVLKKKRNLKGVNVLVYISNIKIFNELI